MENIDYKKLLSIIDPPEPVEIVAECRISRIAMASPISNPERYVKEEICREIARELMKRDLVEILCQDQPINDSIVFHAKVKVFERGYKLKILV